MKTELDTIINKYSDDWYVFIRSLHLNHWELDHRWCLNYKKGFFWAWKSGKRRGWINRTDAIRFATDGENQVNLDLIGHSKSERTFSNQLWILTWEEKMWFKMDPIKFVFEWTRDPIGCFPTKERLNLMFLRWSPTKEREREREPFGANSFGAAGKARAGVQVAWKLISLLHIHPLKYTSLACLNLNDGS